MSQSLGQTLGQTLGQIRRILATALGAAKRAATATVVIELVHERLPTDRNTDRRSRLSGLGFGQAQFNRFVQVEGLRAVDRLVAVTGSERVLPEAWGIPWPRKS